MDQRRIAVLVKIFQSPEIIYDYTLVQNTKRKETEESTELCEQLARNSKEFAWQHQQQF